MGSWPPAEKIGFTSLEMVHTHTHTHTNTLVTMHCVLISCYLPSAQPIWDTLQRLHMAAGSRETAALIETSNALGERSESPPHLRMH